MALSTPPSSTGTSPRVNALDTDLCALVCAASAGVHGALVVPHAAESTRLAVAFALVTVALAITAWSLARDPMPAAVATAAGLLLAVATAYVLSRTSGLPGLTEHPEPFDALGTAVSLGELAAAVVAVRHLNPRRSS